MKEIIIKSKTEESEEYKFKIRRLSFKDMKAIRELRKKFEKGDEDKDDRTIGYYIIVETIKRGVVEPKLTEDEIWELPSFVVIDLNDHIMAYTQDTPFEDYREQKERFAKMLVSLQS